MAHVLRLIFSLVFLLPFSVLAEEYWRNNQWDKDMCMPLSAIYSYCENYTEYGGYVSSSSGGYVCYYKTKYVPASFNFTKCDPACPAGQERSPITHACVPVCPEGQTRDSSTGQCIAPQECKSGETLYSFSGFYTDDHESVCIDGCEADLQRYIEMPSGGGDGVLKGRYVATGGTCTVMDELPESADTSCTPPATANPPACPNNGSPFYNCESGWQCMSKPWDCSGYNANDGTHEYHWNGQTCQQMPPCETGTVRNSIGVCVQSGNPDPGNPDPSNPGGDPGDPSDPANPGGDIGGGDPGTNPGGDSGGGDGSEHCKPGFVWSGTGCVAGSGGGGNGTNPDDGDGNTDDDGSGGSWSGTCGAAPVCDGDPVLCAIAKMQHERYCETEWMRKDNELSRLGQESYDSLNSVSDADANAALNKDGELDINFSDMWEDNQKEWVRPPVSGQCIDIPAFEVMGATIKMDAGPLCAVADFVRVILHILAYMAVMRAVVKG